MGFKVLSFDRLESSFLSRLSYLDMRESKLLSRKVELCLYVDLPYVLFMSLFVEVTVEVGLVLMAK